MIFINLPFNRLKLFITFLAFGATTLFSCNKFEYSPYVTENEDTPGNLNATNIAKLLSTESTSDDTVTILFTGDSQRFYDHLDDLVAEANEYSNIDFLLLDGDISDFGLLQEFLWVNQRLENLHIPYICVVGNHDLTSSGPEIYNQMFGPKNFSFTYKNYKFLCHDDCSREYNFPGNVPDLNWLSSELTNSPANWYVGVSHIPPWSEDFDQNLAANYENLFRTTPGFIASLHGHLVAPFAPDEKYFDSVLYLVTSDLATSECYLIKLIHGSIITQRITY